MARRFFISSMGKGLAIYVLVHELCHVLGLHHRQNSNEHLMRSKTLRWQLNEGEIESARAFAARKALCDLSPLRGGTFSIHVKD